VDRDEELDIDDFQRITDPEEVELYGDDLLHRTTSHHNSRETREDSTRRVRAAFLNDNDIIRPVFLALARESGSLSVRSFTLLFFTFFKKKEDYRFFSFV
jgi:hypothetical protein